jgi:hypothetical protein
LEGDNPNYYYESTYFDTNNFVGISKRDNRLSLRRRVQTVVDLWRENPTRNFSDIIQQSDFDYFDEGGPAALLDKRASRAPQTDWLLFEVLFYVYRFVRYNYPTVSSLVSTGTNRNYYSQPFPLSCEIRDLQATRQPVPQQDYDT